ncbi:MAG: arsenic resistance protein [Pseudomonadota bacterium]
MIGLLFFELRLSGVFKAFGNLRFLAIAWGANFLVVPIVGFAIANLVLADEPLLFIGLMIYFLAPCTDWFLAFTRMAQGDTELGAALIPINLVTQLLLFPLWLWLFTPTTSLVDVGAVAELLVQWFLLPFVIAQTLRIGLEKLLPAPRMERVCAWTTHLLPLVLAALILQIFASSIGGVASHIDAVALVVVAVLMFFSIIFFVGFGIARLARLNYPQFALLSMTLAARNAPLMLALVTVAIPNQPLLLAVIVLGMLVEIPLLTALKHLLLRRHSIQK